MSGNPFRKENLFIAERIGSVYIQYMQPRTCFPVAAIHSILLSRYAISAWLSAFERLFSRFVLSPVGLLAAWRVAFSSAL
jgi:hypothetical protein